MKQLTIMDKLKTVIDITSSNKTYIVVICLLAFLSILFATTNRKNAKESKKTYGIIYIVTIILILIKYYSSLSTMFDHMMNNLFVIVLFPNISVYLAAIITTNIIMWISMFGKKTKLLSKIINSIAFFCMHYLLILNLSIITNEKLDVFNQASLYQNGEVHSLIELSSNIFIVWIAYLIIYKLLTNYLEKHHPKNEKAMATEAVKVVNSSVSVPNNINYLPYPYTVKRDQTKVVTVYQKPATTNEYDSILTVDDYKTVLAMLKKKNTIEVAKTTNEEYIKEKKKIEEENQQKLSELMNLYRSI